MVTMLTSGSTFYPKEGVYEPKEKPPVYYLDWYQLLRYDTVMERNGDISWIGPPRSVALRGQHSETKDQYFRRFEAENR